VKAPLNPPRTDMDLKHRPFLRLLTPESAAELEQRGVRRQWSRNVAMFRANDECTGVHIIVDGLVKLFRSSPAGREQIILLQGAGDALTLAPIFDDGTHVTSADTLKPTTTLYIHRDDFLEIYSRRSDLREAVLIEMARRFRVIVDLVDTITLKTVPARVATHLIELASLNGALDGSEPFSMPLSQDEIAHVLATSRESVARTLSELRSAGVIEQRGSRIRIANAAALLAWSQTGSAVQSFSDAFRLRGESR
jgi:CRP-like cAMP-binding protein